MRAVVVAQSLLLIAGCAVDTGVDELEIAMVDHTTCEGAFEVALDRDRKQRVWTDSAGAEASQRYCPDGMAAAFLYTPRVSGQIAYTNYRPTYYYVDDCSGEPVQLVHIQTGSDGHFVGDADPGAGGFLTAKTWTRRFEGENLFFLRCQEPDQRHPFDMWLEDEPARNARHRFQ